ELNISLPRAWSTCAAAICPARVLAVGFAGSGAANSERIVNPDRADAQLRLLYVGVCAVIGHGGALPEPTAHRFVPMRANQSGWLLPFVILVSAVELSAMHAFVHVRWPGHPLVHVVLLALHLYGLLWIAGDHW